VSVDENLIIN